MQHLCTDTVLEVRMATVEERLAKVERDLKTIERDKLAANSKLGWLEIRQELFIPKVT